MRKFLVCVAGLSCLLVIGSSTAMAQQFYRGGSGLGISFSFGNGYNNFGGYNRGYGSRSDWCRANYRSYDPRTGYYRAYSGRLVYCG